MSSPTQRTLALLRKQGMTCQITEKWNPFSKTRQDLFGGIDIVCLDPEHSGVIGVQTTSQAHASERTNKLLAEPKLKMWVQTGNRLFVIAWRKIKAKRGAKRATWQPTIKELTFADFIQQETAP
jgi:hypothetical protein